jgi:hypothetical protein
MKKILVYGDQLIFQCFVEILDNLAIAFHTETPRQPNSNAVNNAACCEYSAAQ